MAHWPSLQIVQVSVFLMRSDSGAAAKKLPFPGPYGRRYQFLAKANEGIASGLCPNFDTVKLMCQ